MRFIVVSKEIIIPSSPTPFELKTYKLTFIDQQIPPYYTSSIHYYLYNESTNITQSKMTIKLKTYKLTFIDQQIPPYYTSSIHYYLYNESTNITQSKMTIKLKTSLSKTLTHFYPLAGKLSKNRNTIDCNDEGVQFLVVRVESNLLDIIKSPVIEELNQLVMVESSYVEEQLAIQVNLFACGGIAVGISMSHRIMDACSLSSFVSHWFSTTKGSETSLIGPVLDSAVLFPPMKSYEYSSTVHSPLKNIVTKRFVFSSLAINKLKHEVVKNDFTLVNPTRVEVVTALIWKCATAALGDCNASVAFHIVNFRKKMVPSLQDHQFGNLFQLAKSIAHPSTDLASLVATLQSSFGKINDKYMKSLTGENGVEIARGNFKEIKNCMIQEGVRVFKFSSWCGFSVNEGDFGWGKPIWLSIANLGDENSTVLVDSTWDDGIEAWVVMNKDNMIRFEQNTELQGFIGSANYPASPIRPSCRL